MTSSQENATPLTFIETRRELYYCVGCLCEKRMEKRMDCGVGGRKWFQFDYTYTMRALMGGGGSRMRKGEENWRRWGHATDVWRKVYAYSRLHMQRRDVFIQHVTSSGRVAAKWRADHLMRYINSCVYRPMMQSANPIHRRLSSEQHPLKKERKETACQ
jgi:hypothetical protein